MSLNCMKYYTLNSIKSALRAELEKWAGRKTRIKLYWGLEVERKIIASITSPPSSKGREHTKKMKHFVSLLA